MGFEMPNLGLYNLIHGVMNAMYEVPDAKFGVVQPHTWGYQCHAWGCITPCMGLFGINDMFPKKIPFRKRIPKGY
jgi:hypothetical protein